MHDTDQAKGNGQLFLVTMAACLAFWIAVGVLAVLLVNALS